MALRPLPSLTVAPWRHIASIAARRKANRLCPRHVAGNWGLWGEYATSHRYSDLAPVIAKTSVTARSTKR